MKAQFDIEKLIERGTIDNELDFERAMIAERKLRLMSGENVQFKTLRKKLRDILIKYEKEHWSDVNMISDSQLKASDKAEQTAEEERVFIEKRKSIIRKKLKALDLTQEELGYILGHKSKSHMSELMNGIRPFTLPDLIAISKLLKADIKDLVPPFLSEEKTVKIRTALLEINKKPGLIKKLMAAACI